MDRPLLLVGTSAAFMFLAVHAELRLLAPAALLGILGAWIPPTSSHAKSTRPLGWLTSGVVAGVIINLAMYVSILAANTSTNANSQKRFDSYFDAQLALTPSRDVLIVGPADLWMGLLWRHHIRVGAQIGGEGEPLLRDLSQEQRLQWLRDEFADGTIGACYSTTDRVGATARISLGCSSW